SGKARPENQAEALVHRQRVVSRNSLFAGGGRDASQIDAATVVVNGDMYSATFTESGQSHFAYNILAGRSSFLRTFEAMADGVAHQMQKRFGNSIGERLIDGDVANHDFKLN